MTAAPADLEPVSSAPDDLEPVGSSSAPVPIAAPPQTAPEQNSAPDIGNRFSALYGGSIDTLNTRLLPHEKAAFDRLDSVSDKSPAARAQAINQAYFSPQLVGMPHSQIERNWPSVRASLAKNVYGVDEPDISDTKLFNLQVARQQQTSYMQKKEWASGTPFHRFKMLMGHFPDHFAQNAAEFAQGGEKTFSPIAPLPSLKDIPDIPSSGLGNPALVAGVYNSVVKPTVDSFLSPGGIATAGLGGELAAAKKAGSAVADVAGKVLHTVFAATMAKAAVEATPEMMRVMRDTDSTLQQKTEAVGSVVTPAFFAVVAPLKLAMDNMPAEDRASLLQKVQQNTESPAGLAGAIRDAAADTDHAESGAHLNDAAAELEKIAGSPGAIGLEGQPIEEAPVRPPAEYIGTQEGYPEGGIPDIELFNLTEDIPDHPAGSTVSRETLEKSGMTVTRDAEGAFKVEKTAPHPEPQKSAETAPGAKEADPEPAKQEAVKSEVKAIEAAPADEHLSSVKRASVDAQLERMGFEPTNPAEAKTWKAGVAGALERFAKDPERGANLVRRALAGDRRFSTEDVWDSQVYERQLQDEVTAAEKRYDEALQTGDPAALAAADAELFDKQATLKQASQAINEVMGTEAGRALNARKAMLREDYSLAALERKYRKSTASADIPDAVQKELADKADQIAALQDQLKKSMAERAKIRPPAEPRIRVPKLSQSFLERLSTQADEARERLSKKAGLSASVVGEEGPSKTSIGADLNDYAVIVADMLAKGVVKTAHIAARLVNEFGESIKPHVDAVIDLAKDQISAAKYTEVLERRKAALESQIKTLAEKVNSGDLSTTPEKASRPEVQEIEELAQQRDALREQLNGMREQAAKLKALEDAIAEKEAKIAEGDLSAKETAKNRPATEEIETLKQQRDYLNDKISDLRKEKREESSDGKKLKAELDHLQKAIDEKQAKIKSGDLSTKPTVANRPSVEAVEKLKQERDALNKELAEARKEAAKPTEAERIADKVADIEQSIAEKKEKIRTGDLETKKAAANRPQVKEIEEARQRLEEVNKDLAEARKGPPVSKEESALKAWRTRTEKEIQQLQSGEPKPTRVPLDLPFTPEDLELKKQLETLKKEVAAKFRANEEARRPMWLKTADKVVWAGETSILTSLGIFLKIPVSAFWKTVTAPFKELAGTVAGKVFPRAATFADMQVQPTFMSLLSTEGKAARATATEGARAAGQAARNRLTTEETLFVPDSLPPEGKDFVRSIHRALHLPAQINEFTRRVSTIENNLIASGHGESLSDPAVWTTIRVRAYTEAYRAAYLEKDALMSGLISAAVRSIESKGKKYNAENLAALMTMFIEMDNPVKNVPVNIISQTGEAVTGSVVGTAQILNAYRNGFENMKPGQLDAAFRRVKNGTVGAVAMLGAWYAYENIGGSKTAGTFAGTEDKKRKASEPKQGQVKVGDAMLPEMGFHNETWAAAQMIASYHHLLEQQYGKPTVEANADAFLRAALGPIEDMPGIKQSLALELTKTKEPVKSLARWSAARAIPSGVAQIARWIDTPGDFSFETFMKQPNPRFTRDATDEFAVRVPGLREDVPKTKAQKQREIQERLRK